MPSFRSFLQLRGAPLQHGAIHLIELPPNGMMPDLRESVAAHEIEPTQQISLLPEMSAECWRATQCWIYGHHAFIVCLAIASYAAEQVMHAATIGDLDSETTWMNRLAELRMGMAAFTCAAGNMPSDMYEGFIRREMEKVDSGFSGLSSLENWVFDEAVLQLKASLSARKDTLPEEQARVIRSLSAAYDAANRKWWEHHARLMRRLLTVPISLARKAAQDDALDKQPHYNELKTKHRTPDRIETYDHFFACQRRPVSLAQFQRTTQLVLERIRPFQDPDPELQTFFTQAEKTMNEIIEERLGT